MTARGGKSTARPKSGKKPARPALLSGGNPQIAKGEGDGPVQAYVAAVPGWKREGELDEAQLATWVRQAAALPGWTP